MKPTNFAPKSNAFATQSPSSGPQQQGASPLVQLPARRPLPAIIRSAEIASNTSTETVPKRKNQLEDYIARIRQHTAHKADPATRPGQTQTPPTASTFTTTIADQGEQFRYVSGAMGLPGETTERTDSGHAHADTPAMAFPPRTEPDHFPIDTEITTARYLKTHGAVSPESAATNAQPPVTDEAYQRHLIEEISTAIASTVTGGESREGERPTADQNSSVQANLPIEVAAWDVEDFRWPVLSNQMIATASKAMEELYAQVRAVTEVSDARPHARLAVAGADRGEGTSTIAISLARWAAACGNSVLLVDADMTKPSLTTSVGLQHELSWMDAITRGERPAEVIIRSKHANLCVMPLAPIQSLAGLPRHAYDSLGTFVGLVEQYFDWVILDFGPGEQMLAELSRPELLIDSALLVSSQPSSNEIVGLKNRLQQLGLSRFVLAQNSVQQAEAA